MRQQDAENPPQSTYVERHVAGSLAQLVRLLAREAARQYMCEAATGPADMRSRTIADIPEETER
jgi:hypothetical protein